MICKELSTVLVFKFQENVATVPILRKSKFFNRALEHTRFPHHFTDHELESQKTKLPAQISHPGSPREPEPGSALSTVLLSPHPNVRYTLKCTAETCFRFLCTVKHKYWKIVFKVKTFKKRGEISFAYSIYSIFQNFSLSNCKESQFPLNSIDQYIHAFTEKVITYHQFNAVLIYSTIYAIIGHYDLLKFTVIFQYPNNSSVYLIDIVLFNVLSQTKAPVCIADDTHAHKQFSNLSYKLPVI